MSIFTKLLILGCVFSASAFSFENCTLMKDPCHEGICAPRVEAKAGYFIFANKKMRDVYSDGGYELQLSGSYPLKDWLHIYGCLGYMQARGKSRGFHQKSTFSRVPVDLGFKSIIDISCCADWHFAIGPRYFYARQHNHSRFVNKHISKSGVGLFVNTGIDFLLNSCFYMTLFGEYSYEPARPSSSKEGVHKRNIQIGGFVIGGGAGYSF